MKPVHKCQRKQHGAGHSYQEVKGYFFVILTNGQIQHGIKHKHQCHIPTVPREYKDYRHLSHQILSDAKGNTENAAENHIYDQSHIITGQDVLISFLVNNIRHIL